MSVAANIGAVLFFAMQSNINNNPIPTQPSGPLGVQDDQNLRF